MPKRHYTATDQAMINLDQALRTLFGKPQLTERKNPAENIQETDLSEDERDHTARHAEEVQRPGVIAGQEGERQIPEPGGKARPARPDAELLGGTRQARKLVEESGSAAA